MTTTYVNEDGVLVIVAGPVVLESSTGLGEADNGEVATDVDGDAAGE